MRLSGIGESRDGRRRWQGFLLTKLGNQQKAVQAYICRDIYRNPQTPTA